MDKPLHGKVIMVTGASAGIGAATITALLDAGARIVAVARRSERMLALQEQFSISKDQLLVVGCDIQEAQQVQALMAQALEWGGSLDVLINNAGLSRCGLL